FPLHARDRERFLVAGAIGPAAFKSVLARELSKRLNSVGKVIRIFEGYGVIGGVGCILYIIDLVTEALKANNVMNVLPHDSGYGAAPHEAKEDDFFPVHDFSISCLGSCPAAR